MAVKASAAVPGTPSAAREGHRPEGWERTATFPMRDGEVFIASRNYEIFNQRGIVVTKDFDHHGEFGSIQNGWSWYVGV